MSYWKGLGVAVAIDLIWIMGCPVLATEPPPEAQRESNWVLNPRPGVSYEVDQLARIGQLEDSLMERLQDQPNDVDAMQKLADVYASNGWYEAAIGPLARALQLDPTRRSLWSALDTAIAKSGRAKMTDKELTEKAAAFVEAVGMWGHGC